MEEDDTLTKHLSQKDPIISLYSEEEIEDVSTTSSFTKSNTVITGQVSEVSSTSEDNYQVPSTSSKSLFMDLYEEDILNTDSENMNNPEKDTSASDAAGTEKRKPGLLLLGEYADSGNDTEEEALNALKVKQGTSKETVENASSKDAGSEDVVGETVTDENKPLETSVESDMTKVLEELPLTVGKDSSLVEEKVEDKNDSDSHAAQDARQAKLERSVSKEEGQISAESDSSDSEQSSEDRKDSIKQKDLKKNKSKKKDKKKKKKKQKKQKHSGDKKDSDVTGDEKKERQSVKGRSRESSEKRRFSKHSRSRSQERSRDRSSRRRVRSRSRSQDKRKQSRHVREKSRRSRSRSSSRRHIAPNRNKDLKSKSRSPKRSASPRNRRREREDKWSSISRSRRDSLSKRKRKVSRSRSPRKRRERSPEHRRSRSPKKRSYSPDKRRRTSPENSPRESSLSRKEKSPRKRERKQSQSTPVKMSHRTSSASDSLDSGHFTNIPLSKANKPEESEPDSKEPVKKPSPVPEKKSEPSVPPKAMADIEKQFSPMYSPEKPWEDEFDFVFTEHLSPRQGTEKSMEDVLFGSEAKTPDFKRPITVESKKNKEEPVAKKEEKKEKKEKKVKTGREKNNVPQEEENQDGSSRIQQASSDTAESAIKANGQNISASKTVEAAKTVFEDKPDQLKKRISDNESSQASTNTNKSAFMQSKLEAIPFLDEAPPTQPPVGSSTVHPAKSQVDIKGSSPLAGTGKKQNELQTAKDIIESSITRINKATNNVDVSPMDMEMSSPEGDIIDRMNEEFWRQQQQQQPVGMNQAEVEGRQSREGFTVESGGNEQCLFEEPYEPESGLIIGEEYEDLNNIADPKERRKKEKQQQKEKTKVQELIDKLHRQARVEEEVKHVLKAYYKHRDISKDEYKSILRRAVPQVTNSSSAIDPERIRSLVKKYVAKIKGQRVDS